MLNAMVAYFLGPWGRKILEFYIEHSGIINSILLIYVSLLILSFSNYKRIMNDVIQIVKKELEGNPKRKKFIVSWEKTIDKVAFFPFIANKMSFFPKRCTYQNIENMVNKDKVFRDIKKGIVIKGKDGE